MVIAEHSAEALSALNWMMGEGSDGCGLRKSVFQVLMIALGMTVRQDCYVVTIESLRASCVQSSHGGDRRGDRRWACNSVCSKSRASTASPTASDGEMRGMQGTATRCESVSC
jgi:hypothetical protein